MKTEAEIKKHLEYWEIIRETLIDIRQFSELEQEVNKVPNVVAKYIKALAIIDVLEWCLDETNVKGGN